MRVLVTGGAGFIGSNLTPRLLEKGYSVVVLDNLFSGKMENLSTAQEHPAFSFVRGDIRDPQTVHTVMRDVDALVHLAALIDVSASVADPMMTHDINVTGTVNLLQEAVKCEVDRFIFASSTAVYGDAKVLPVKEDTPLQPISPYAASKAASESYCCAYTGCYGLDTVRLRFFNIYGPKNEGSPYSGVITKFIQKAQRDETLTIEGDGEQTRDFIHVNDVVGALTAALEGKSVRGEVFNVCTGKPTSINGLADELSSVMGRKLKTAHLPARVGDIRFSYGDPTKAALKLNFKARIDMAKGLRLLIKTGSP